MTATVRLVTEPDQGARLSLARAALTIGKPSKSEDVFKKIQRHIAGLQTDLFACLAEKAGPVSRLVNGLYHKHFPQKQACPSLSACLTYPDARGARAGDTLIAAVVSRASGRIFAQVYWLTTKDNVQAQRLYNRVANLAPFVKYQV